MSYIDKSVPAFPIDCYVKGSDPYPGDGMMLRDYFAAKAMAQLIDHTAKREYIARDAYEMADAMLKEREK